MIVANNPDSVLHWDEFIDALDNDKKLIAQLNKFMTNQEKKNNIFNSEEIKEGDSKKTKRFLDIRPQSLSIMKVLKSIQMNTKVYTPIPK